ncbi:MAG: isochorismatase family protein [bacterium]|nr:isochorismatase family protein [bacterium]
MWLTDLSIDELFDRLDIGSNGELSRADLRNCGFLEGLYRYYTPLYAVLDLLSITGAISRSRFISYLKQIADDSNGLYGEILHQSILFKEDVWENKNKYQDEPSPTELENTTGFGADESTGQARIPFSEPHVSAEIAGVYREVMQDTEDEFLELSCENTALLVIDLQRSFTSGVWKQSFGPTADFEVAPIRLAFENCARLLHSMGGNVDTMCTRCPFPPESYQWHEKVGRLLGPAHPYFIKPGNSVMWPSTNGFREWVRFLLKHNKNTLVIGGCTLNSCVRVSAIDTMAFFKNEGLRVFVDLSLCGARAGNFIASPQYGGLSSVESAVKQMREAGVRVVGQCRWK